MPKKKQISDDMGADIEQFGTILDHMGVQSPQPTPAEQTKQPEVNVADLLARIDSLQNTVNAVASRPTYVQQPVVQAPAAPSAPKFDWADPVTEPEAFGATLAQYTTYVMEQQKAQERAQQEATRAASQKANSLWSDFTAQYKDYADKGDQIGYAYQRVTSNLRDQGYDPDVYANQNRPQLFKAVVDEYTKVFGPLKAAAEDAGDTEGRTAGIFGGFESGGQPAKGKEKPGDMLSDLKDIQKAMGIF